MTKTRKHMRHSSFVKGWNREKPGYHEKTVMLAHCGHKCFLGPKKKYPICKKNTCKISSHGVYAAYMRARQQHNNKISKKAKKMLVKMGAKNNT